MSFDTLMPDTPIQIMYPEICKIGSFTIYSYGLMMVVAFMVSSVLVVHEAKIQNINPEVIFNLAFLVFIFGIIGARIFFVIENLNYYKEHPIEIIILAHGGLSWFGAFVLGTLAGVIYIKKQKFNIYKILDLFSPFVALGHAIGRIGCLLNGCCYGIESRFGIYFPVHQAVLIPTQIYSSIILIFIFILLRILQNRPHRDGQVFITYILLYSIGRFFIEFWRAEHEAILLRFNLFQIICIVLFVFASFALFRIKSSKR